MKKQYLVRSLSDLDSIAKEFLNDFKSEHKFAFYAPMGTGKTTFIKALCKVMGVEDIVSSPTYSLVNEYFSVTFGSIYHFDFYRLNDEREALDFGADEILDSDSYCFMEWPEKIPNLLPENCVKVNIQQTEEGRLIEAL